MKPEHLKLLSDKNWRLNNLYWITDKEGKPTRFRMTPEQREYFEGIHSRNIILKARQLGFTTEVCIIQLDAALFESAKCALIAHTLNGAKRLFREKVKYAYDKLPAEIKAANPASNDTSGELVFKKGGSLYVSTSFRGGTLRYLHVSEFGKICAKYPDKAREIVTGAFEAVSTGCFATIESTAEGRAGDFFDYCQTAEKALLQGKALSALDWNFFFFSWWKNPQYAIDPVESLPVRLLEYFAEMEAKHGVVVNERQKAWYYAKEKTLGDDMKREYPTIPAEAFQQSVEGAYYAKQFRWLYTNKRIGQIPDSGKWLSVGDATARQWVENNYIASRFERFGYFSQGSTLTSNTQALVDSTGLYWIKTGEIPTSGYVVPPGTNPDYPDFMCVGYLTDYDWMSVLNWGADNTYSISDNVGEDSVDSFNLAGYHAEKRAALFNTIQTVRIPTGTYLLDKTTLVEGESQGLTIYRNQEVMIFLRNGVDFNGDGDSTLLYVADGVVERNKENGGTKGFLVFGDGIREIQNASVRNLLIDENGDNNLVPPPNWSGAQAHCPAVACYEGSNGVIVSGVNVKNAPGSNVMIFQESQAAFNSYDTLIENCSFYRVADAITGNTNLNDHSSIRIHSDGYLISNVKCIQPTMSDLCTVFECHGNGDVKKCLTKKARYPFLKANDGATAKSETTFSSCEFYDAGSALVLDCTPNKTSNAVFINNYGTFRSEKQNIGYFNNSAITSLQPNVINTPQQNIDINIVLNGNTVIQKERIGWPDDQITSNNIFNVLKIKSIKSNDNEFHGFRFAMNLREQKENASISIDDVLYKCGVDGYGGVIDNTCIRYTNGYNSSYGVNLSELYVKYTMHSCLYGGLISILQTAAGESVGIEKCNIEYSSDTYIVPFLGISPKDAQQYYVNGECFADISTSSPLNGYSSVFGKFTVHSKQLGYSAVFSKPHGIVSPGWFFKGVMNVSGSVPDRPYGNNNGDRYDVITSPTNIIGYKYNGTAWVEITI